MPHVYSVVLVTVPDSKTADSIAGTLLEEKLAACVNQVPGVKSSYWWEDKINYAEEILLLIKTQASLMPRVIECVRKNHPYTMPEIISLPIDEGDKPYLDWIKSSTHAPRPSRAAK